ncbi:MAG: alpha/beta hydrolase [Proteobacteria bacterium]|nr:alpha/beta hydrolase [Pseudomonadota bacterium]
MGGAHDTPLSARSRGEREGPVVQQREGEVGAEAIPDRPEPPPPHPSSPTPGAERGALCLGPRRLETAWWGKPPVQSPTIVLLHEGLGSVSLWRDFPARLAAATGCGVFAYSRFGYGRSDPEPLPWPPSYMHREAEDVLPRVLAAAGIGRHVLLGHSDGASIAAIHAGAASRPMLRGLVLIAPHFFVENAGLASIVAIGAQYETTDLRARLARHHADPDNAFHGWSGAWTNSDFRAWNILDSVPRIAAPMLLLQGTEDAYGSAEQLYAGARAARAPAETLLIDGAGHAPHLERADETLAVVARFVDHVL